MRNDHLFHRPLPTSEEIERAVRAAHRARSEAVHAYLKRAANWIRLVFRPVSGPHGDTLTTRVRRLRRWWPQPRDAQERYLVAATNHTDLERRMRVLERANGGRPGDSSITETRRAVPELEALSARELCDIGANVERGVGRKSRSPVTLQRLGLFDTDRW